jgi:hypothetical protein
MHKFCTTRLVTWIQDNLLGCNLASQILPVGRELDVCHKS